MSKHFFRQQVRGRPLLIDTGWDRPCGHFYLNVYDEAAQGDEDLVYASMDDHALYGPERGRLYGGFSLQELLASLAAQGITLPDGLAAALEDDERRDAGNGSRTWA